MVNVTRVDKKVFSTETIMSAINSGNARADNGRLFLNGTLIAYVTSDGNGPVKPYNQPKPKQKTATGENKVDKVKSTAMDVVDLNRKAATDSAKMEGGRLALNQIMKAYVKLPWGFGKLKNNVLIRLAVANVASGIVSQFVSRKDVVDGSKYMVKSAMDDAVKKLDIVNKIEAILDNNIAKIFKKDTPA